MDKADDSHHIRAKLGAHDLVPVIPYPLRGTRRRLGTGVTARLGFAHPEQVSGIHVTSAASGSMRPYLDPRSRALSAAEQRLREEREQWLRDEGGYSHIQGTKPQTLSYGLNDSPAGLAAWIVEKFRTWSDCSGEIERRFSKDEILTTVTILGDADD